MISPTDSYFGADGKLLVPCPGLLLPAPAPGRRKGGFSLLELLLVVAIIGVAMAVVMPRFSVAMSGGQLNMAARTVARLGRYARTMALLHNTGVELVLLQGEGDPEVMVRVAGFARGATGDPAETAAGPGRHNLPEGGPFAGFPDGIGDGGDGSPEDPPDDGIGVARVLPGVRIEFLGYTDTVSGETVDAGVGSDDTKPDEIVISFAANGICRPYRILVEDRGGVGRELRVDRFGRAEIKDRTL